MIGRIGAGVLLVCGVAVVLDKTKSHDDPTPPPTPAPVEHVAAATASHGGGMPGWVIVVLVLACVVGIVCLALWGAGRRTETPPPVELAVADCWRVTLYGRHPETGEIAEATGFRDQPGATADQVRHAVIDDALRTLPGVDYDADVMPADHEADHLVSEVTDV